jgi:hypothetical protein
VLQSSDQEALALTAEVAREIQGGGAGGGKHKKVAALEGQQAADRRQQQRQKCDGAAARLRDLL